MDFYIKYSNLLSFELPNIPVLVTQYCVWKHPSKYPGYAPDLPTVIEHESNKISDAIYTISCQQRGHACPAWPLLESLILGCTDCSSLEK